MNKLEKLVDKFLRNPTSLHFSEIEKVLLIAGFKKINAKGSHNKFKHPHLKYDLVIPLHNNDCKEFYKKLAAKEVEKLMEL
jgi:predicted RNA binding protein YcfA (HicA-like mRNA interferase family)